MPKHSWKMAMCSGLMSRKQARSVISTAPRRRPLDFDLSIGLRPRLNPVYFEAHRALHVSFEALQRAVDVEKVCHLSRASHEALAQTRPIANTKLAS